VVSFSRWECGKWVVHLFFGLPAEATESQEKSNKEDDTDKASQSSVTSTESRSHSISEAKNSEDEADNLRTFENLVRKNRRTYEVDTEEDQSENSDEQSPALPEEEERPPPMKRQSAYQDDESDEGSQSDERRQSDEGSLSFSGEPINTPPPPVGYMGESYGRQITSRLSELKKEIANNIILEEESLQTSDSKSDSQQSLSKYWLNSALNGMNISPNDIMPEDFDNFKVIIDDDNASVASKRLFGYNE